MNSDMLLGILRHALTVWGATLVSGGYMNDSQLQDAIGAVMVLGATGWSIYNKRQQKAALVAAAGANK